LLRGYIRLAYNKDAAMTRIRAARAPQPPWLHVGERAPRLQPRLDLNQASAKDLVALGLSPAAAKRVVARRRTRPFRDLDDLVTSAKLGTKERAKLLGRAVGSVRSEVTLLDAAVNNERIFSERPWGLVARFLPPTRGVVEVASVAVRWAGRPFVVERAVTPGENREGTVEFSLAREHALPPGPVELSLTLYDDGGGADTWPIEAWVLPSNPLRLFVSPRNRSIFNGSVRPDWAPPNWVTAVNLTFVNGDAGSVAIDRPMAWRFWDGGVGATLVEGGNFTWPSAINVPGFGTYSGWMTFSSPPGSGIHDRYENKEDMSIELVFQRSGGVSVAGTVTCRIMAGWGVNVIKVGDYSAAESATITNGVNDALSVYENHGLTFSSIQRWIIHDADAGGYPVLDDHDEWEDLLDDWSVQNDSVDCFIVEDMWSTFAGWSPIPGPGDKDGACEDDGLAASMSMVCLAHELGHYMGGQEHADGEGRGNVMHSICGGRNFTYNQYRGFLGHPWTRVVR
jgi:Helix-hairpin-helix motif